MGDNLWLAHMNTAQRLLCALGMHPLMVQFSHHGGVDGGAKRHSNTKRGPGRIHKKGPING